MTVSSTTTRVTYTGNGVTTAFAVSFQFFAASEIEVIERVIVTGAETLKTLTTHYTVSGGAGATGTVTAVGGAPSSSVQWVIRRVTARTQDIDYTPNDPFPAETHEQGLDRLKMNVQELAEDNARALKFPKTDSAGLSAEIPSSVERAGRFLTFDGSGAPTVSAGSVDGLTVTPFAAALLDDADAAAARSTLGISGLDITGLTALTTPANNDELPIYDLSALANRKITLADLFKAITALSVETAPATDDELALYDTSAGSGDKITLANMLKVVNALTEDTTPDLAADFVLTYDASASAAKKVKPSNLSAGSIGAVSVQVFTGSGTWTKPTGVKFVRVICVGGGGGGGGAAFDGIAGGGGGGGYAEKILDVTAISSRVVTIGAAGAAGSSGGGAGGAGGDTSFGSDCIGKGGSGGVGRNSAGVKSGGAGGGAGTGDFSIVGESGFSGADQAATYILSGEGGDAANAFGYGGKPIGPTGNVAGNVGTGYGAGGSGASWDDAGTIGGAGTAGICIVYEYK